jgi:hypothetical protein
MLRIVDECAARRRSVFLGRDGEPSMTIQTVHELHGLLRPRHYPATPAPRTDLPFVAGPSGDAGEWCDWAVPPTDDYDMACRMGRAYAAHLIQWFKENPGVAGQNILGDIVASMDMHDQSAAKGYRVGFFSHLEELLELQARSMDVFADLAVRDKESAELEDD